jgi:cell wall-associated NlpC family hydrolase
LQIDAACEVIKGVGVVRTFRGADIEKLRHTFVMRRVVWFVLLAVVGAVVGVASARAGDTTTTTTTGTTTASTTTTPSFAPLPASSLPSGCVGAGAAALVLPSGRVIALGTPASSLGPSGYPSSGSVLTFDSSASSGSTCRSAGVSLSSVSLFDGVVTASSVQATDGKGTAPGLAINGSAVTAAAGETVPVDGWGQLTVGATVGRVTAPLVLRLLQAHDSLPAGTAVVVAFAAAALPIAKPRPTATGSSPSRTHAAQTHHSRKHRRRQAQKPPPDFPASPYPFSVGGGFTDSVRDNPVVSIAIRYLGVPYQWGGGSPTTGFDCSGLVTYVFGKLGVSLPHYAASQWYSPDAVWVAPNRLQPGDLVFFTGSDGTRKAPGHVGIYLDDGYIIDAPHTGSFVRIDNLNEPKLADEYVGAKQITSRLLDVRHLFRVPKPGEFITAIPNGFPSPTAIGPLGELGIAATGTAPLQATSLGHWIWASVVLGGVILLLLAGGLVIRRHPAPDATPSPDSSN